MLKNVIPALTIVALNLCAFPAGAVTASDALPPTAAQLVATWDCETTKADGVHYHETDTIEAIGDQWLHGSARPPAQSASREPYYDYYIGHTGSRWVYIQIDPFHINPTIPTRAQGTYFVGTSDNGLDWSVAFPSGEAGYTFAGSANQFTIAHSDLRQVCNKTAPVALQPPPSRTLKCDTAKTGEPVLAHNLLTIARVDPAWWTGEKGWWQGAGSDTASAGHVSYEYNFFPVGNQWVSVAVNGSTGDYLIAKSYSKRTLDGTTWTVIYPTARPGFTFQDVKPPNTIPDYFDIVFADGYQSCCPRDSDACPPPGDHLPPT